MTFPTEAHGDAPLPRRVWAAQAWLPGGAADGSTGGWQKQVLLGIGADGRWTGVRTGVPCPPDAERLAGPALPGLVNAHSHAFQRAFAGLTERREAGRDDFWSWRERMYAVAGRIDAAALRAVATQLYSELLRGGYTQVCEFHYLQHQPDGRPYADPLELAWALADAAVAAGIGLTLLPVLYERAGFDQPALRPEQRRFRSDAASVKALQRGLREARRPGVTAGVAIHSLRAAAPASIHALRAAMDGDDAPIHIHIAEQTQEVDDCLRATGRRPIAWLTEAVPLDARWHLVHATHATRAEIDAVATAGAGVVLCPSTEANLGDGLTDLPAWLEAGVPLTLGSDSHATRAWREELRLLEYGQRLALRARNVAAAPTLGQASTAERLWSRVQAGSARAAGLAPWGLVAGARADLLVADLDDACLLGVPPRHWVDALVFSSPGRPWRDVMVAGRWRVQAHHQPGARAAGAAFASAMQTLHAAGA